MENSFLSPLHLHEKIYDITYDTHTLRYIGQEIYEKYEYKPTFHYFLPRRHNNPLPIEIFHNIWITGVVKQCKGRIYGSSCKHRTND